ncbi:hypothetical protein Xish_03710 [Xenorhabdus ishibashii]|uniref:Uncharacterized protein n=1 Tax=Xenorhabdus ishibashii TaxID=1034471 RepID=A0A2D0K6R3_9GAMM|nr:hypothetical protein Xish_03710 [Xenorhabdus ishibashii]
MLTSSIVGVAVSLRALPSSPWATAAPPTETSCLYSLLRVS